VNAQHDYDLNPGYFDIEPSALTMELSRVEAGFSVLSILSQHCSVVRYLIQSALRFDGSYLSVAGEC